MEKSSKKGLIVFIVIICLVLASSLLLLFFNKEDIGFKKEFTFSFNSGNKSATEETQKASKKYKGEFIANLVIEGTIQEANKTYNQQWLLSTIENLKNNNNNVALAVYINSPGGTVYHADQIYLALQNYKTTGKPIYVYQGPLAASGGYYISLAGNKIYANRNSLTGSIGVIGGTFYDATDLYKKIGIRSTTIHSGKNKTMGSLNEPYTEEQLKIMQSVSDECYNQFCSIVVARRNLSYNQVYALADGRIYTANQALENGLIDRVDSWDNMIQALCEEELQKPGLRVKRFSYQKKTGLMDQLMDGMTNISELHIAAKLGLPLNIYKEMQNNNLYPAYLYQAN